MNRVKIRNSFSGPNQYYPSLVQPLRSSRIKCPPIHIQKIDGLQLMPANVEQEIHPQEPTLPKSPRQIRRKSAQKPPPERKIPEQSKIIPIQEIKKVPKLDIREPQTSRRRSMHRMNRIVQNLLDENDSKQMVDPTKCSYCHESLDLLTAISLPCGHKIHPQCLLCSHKFSFNHKKVCPTCLHPYSFLEIQTEIRQKHQAAIKIQKVYRGFRTRSTLNDFFPVGSKLHMKFLMKKANRASSRLTHAIDNQSDAVDAVITAVDK